MQISGKICPVMPSGGIVAENLMAFLGQIHSARTAQPFCYEEGKRKTGWLRRSGWGNPP